MYWNILDDPGKVKTIIQTPPKYTSIMTKLFKALVLDLLGLSSAFI